MKETQRTELEQLRIKHALYLVLLEPQGAGEPKELLHRALQHLAEFTEAERAYLVIDPSDEDGMAPWTCALACSDEELANIRSVMSRGIVAETLAHGEILHTPSALLDERFAMRPSVRRNAIEAVVCAPIGDDAPIGALYLQGPPGGGVFSAEDLELVKLFGRVAAPVLRALRAEESARLAGDPTRTWRNRLRLDALIGVSPALAEVFRQVELIAPLDLTVLLTGPSGSGKTLLARAIHDNGPRRRGPFLELNCATFQDELAESELFGALAGAHSTAHTQRTGKVAAAEGGTLFLDEIGELSPAVQAKLLQLLQSKQYTPLGGTTPVRANIRIITATNVDLGERVESKEFREDLYYRLNVFPVRMPALKERRQDIAALARHFVLEHSRTHGLPQLGFSPGALSALRQAEWQGNIRELEHCVLRGLLRASAQDLEAIDLRHLFPDSAKASLEGDGQGLTFQEATRRYQADFLARVLEAHAWQVSQAAKQLDISRSQLYNLIKVHELRRPRSDRG